MEIKHKCTGAILFKHAGANLKGANLRDADLRCADLTDADLTDADLGDADLTDADLRCADLRFADLTDADLTDADLRFADLTDADLTDADLAGANLRGAVDVFSIGNPGNWHGHAWLRDGILSIRIGCREFRYAEALAYWQLMTGRLEQLAATEYARQIALARGWRIE